MAKHKPPFPVIDATATEVTYHIRICVDNPGPARKDGSKGRVILEDTNAPVEVLKWLKSPMCLRADRSTGKPVYVYCNGSLVPPGSPDIPDDEAASGGDELPALPAPALPPATEAALQLADGYQRRVEQITEHLEAQLRVARAEHSKEMARLRAGAAAEVENCDKQIAEARDRLAKERKREDEELEELSKRRRAMVEERTAMSQDLRTEVETQRDYRALLAQNLKKGDTIESLVNAATTLQKNGVPVGDIASGLAVWLMQKAGVGIPTTGAE